MLLVEYFSPAIYIPRNIESPEASGAGQLIRDKSRGAKVVYDNFDFWPLLPRVAEGLRFNSTCYCEDDVIVFP